MKERAKANRTARRDRPVRCGVVGLGRVGWATHAKQIAGHPGFELAAVCDLEAERLARAEAETGARGYTRLSRLLADADVDLIVIASQTKDHERMTLASLAAGRHVVVEKPAALTLAGVDRMIRGAREAGRILTVHHNYRLQSHFLYVGETIASGLLGEVFRIKRCWGDFRRRDDWQALRKYGGGLAGNHGVHLLDQCLQLIDSPVQSVWGNLRRVFNPGDAEDDVKIVARTERGMVIDVEVSCADASPTPDWVVLGSHGTLWVAGGQAHLRWFDPARLKPLRVVDSHRAAGNAYWKKPEEDPIPWQTRDEPAVPRRAYDSFYANLWKALRRGAPLLVTPESARLTYDVLARARRHGEFPARTGGL